MTETKLWISGKDSFVNGPISSHLNCNIVFVNSWVFFLLMDLELKQNYFLHLLTSHLFCNYLTTNPYLNFGLETKIFSFSKS